MTAQYSPIQDQHHSISLYPPSTTASGPPDLEAGRNFSHVAYARGMMRTPSPTPSEAKELNSDSAIDWKKIKNWRFWIRREWFWYYVILAVLITLGTLIAIYNEQIVNWLRPAADWMHRTECGWLIPIAITIVISFPPLLGQEIVGILCGLVWGLWVGFAIFAAGTLLGEISNFYAFKYCCRSTGEKLERKNITYACLARVVRDGGFRIVLAARFSALPGHFSTAVCAICGTGIFAFTLATTLSLPRQFVTVYLGVMLRDAGEGRDTSSTSTIINTVVLVVTIAMTVLAMWYIMSKMDKVKHDVIYLRRKARQQKLERATDKGPNGDLDSESRVVDPESGVFSPPSMDHSYETIPLAHQRPDSRGNDAGHTASNSDPRPPHVQHPQPVPLTGYVPNNPFLGSPLGQHAHSLQ